MGYLRWEWFSLISHSNAQGNEAEVITNEGGDRTTPSYVSFTEDEHVIGLPAKQQLARNAKNTIFGVKRVIGKKYVMRRKALLLCHMPTKAVLVLLIRYAFCTHLNPAVP